MDKFIEAILHKRGFVLAVFAVLLVLSAAAASMVSINYNLMDYLPDDAPSTTALDIMNEQYEKGAPNARIMVRDTTVPEALEFKKKIADVRGVDDISWLDDAENIYEPIEFMDPDTVSDYWAQNCALFNVTLDEDLKNDAMTEIRAILGDKGVYSGTAVENVSTQVLTEKEVSLIMKICVLIIFVILSLTTTSWFEPVLLLATIGAAILLNKGSDLLFGEISFVTNSAGSILQMAVSMDYSIFLLHRFAEMREQYDDVHKAMAKAVIKSAGSVISSGITTVMGFAALILMRFKVGPDMGIVMAKAICLSLICVMTFLPSLALCTYKLIDKTEHKSLIPSFEKLANLITKVRVPMLIIFAVITVPCIFAQKQNTFTYGQSGIYGEGTSVGDDIETIESIFGRQNLAVLMVPKDTLAQQKKLAEELKADPKITSVLTYTDTVGVQIPVEFVPKDQVSELISKEYSRYVITLDTAVESDEAFEMVEKIREMAQKYYNDDYQLVGTTVNSYDMRDVVTEDNTKVNIIAIGSIALILLLNFKSVSIPIILLLVIESSIWINLSFPYFADERLFYIGYLIISSVQLGATVDYAILFADRYLENRRTMEKHTAAKHTIKDTALSIITSGSILACAGFMLGTSSNGLIAQLGILVGRGGLLSMVLVLFVLPSLIAAADGIIQKTTMKTNFYKGNSERK